MLNKSRNYAVTVFVAGLFAACAYLTIGQAKSASAAMQAPKPAPEMERLKFYLGEWDYTETYAKSPMSPDGGKNTGLYTSALGPGGNSLINHFHSKGPVGDFEGLIVMTWDPKENAYKSYIFGDSFPGCVVETGQFEGDTLVFRGEFSMGPTKVALHTTNKLVAPGKLVSTEYTSVNGAPETLLVTVDSTKNNSPIFPK